MKVDSLPHSLRVGSSGNCSHAKESTEERVKHFEKE